MYENKKALQILSIPNIFSCVEAAEIACDCLQKSETTSREQTVFMSVRTTCGTGKAVRPAHLSEGQTHSQLFTEQLRKLEAVLMPDLCSPSL